ncbi:hypothetical protein D6C77_04367, partial [Aureobasidium pullulans]
RSVTATTSQPPHLFPSISLPLCTHNSDQLPTSRRSHRCNSISNGKNNTIVRRLSFVERHRSISLKAPFHFRATPDSYQKPTTGLDQPPKPSSSFSTEVYQENIRVGFIRMSSKHLRHSILLGVKPHNGLVLASPLENVRGRDARYGVYAIIMYVGIPDLTNFGSMFEPQASVRPFLPQQRGSSRRHLQGSGGTCRQDNWTGKMLLTG